MISVSKYNGSSVILASASPERKNLLSEAGFKFSIEPADIDESDFSTENINPSQYARQLALAKAKNVAQKYPDSLVIGADTIADFNGQIIGKPADAEQAQQITAKLFSAPHKVITAIAIVRLSDNTEIVESDTTIVYPKKLTEKQIAEHIKSHAWQNKSGAYAIKQCNDEFIEKIDGSLTNVMGLPTDLLLKMLERTAIP